MKLLIASLSFDTSDSSHISIGRVLSPRFILAFSASCFVFSHLSSVARVCLGLSSQLQVESARIDTLALQQIFHSRQLDAVEWSTYSPCFVLHLPIGSYGRVFLLRAVAVIASPNLVGDANLHLGPHFEIEQGHTFHHWLHPAYMQYRCSAVLLPAAETVVKLQQAGETCWLQAQIIVCF